MAKNDGTPVNLLALDGGGIRGICELRVLDEIMKRIQKEQNLTELPRPCDYFHLMAGTSTGGLVAILLSRFKMTTRDAIAAYYDFSRKIFSKKNKKLVTIHEYGVAVFEEIIQGMVAAHGIGELLLDTNPSAQSKAFVCSQRGHNQGPVVRFRSYEAPAKPNVVNSEVPHAEVSHTSSSISNNSVMTNGSTMTKGSNSRTIDTWGNFDDIKIWEAARATTAAPGYFKPMELGRDENKIPFIDGAMGCNNPAYELVDEATALFGTDCVLGSLLSLGTGYSGPKTIGQRKGILGKMDLLTNVKKIVTDTENVHLGLAAQIRPDLDTYFRFQLPAGAEDVDLQDYEKLDYLSQLMKEYIETESLQIDKVVHILLGKAKPRGVTLGQIVRSDHGQICPSKVETRGRPFVSDFFVGREEILEKLAETFNPTSQRHNRKRQHLLHGQPGAGKSQTAAKFLDDYGHWFDIVLWVDASSKQSLEIGFKNIEGFSEYGYSGGGSIKALLRWLEMTERPWILVLDDVRGDVSEYIPRGNKGNVLFTSQNMSMRPKLRSQSITKIEVLNEIEAVELLLCCARLDVADKKKRAEALELSTALGYLPLALEQAGATLRMRDYEISEYAEILENHRDDLLKASGSEDIPAGLQAVYASFDVTYKVLNSRAHDASSDEQSKAARSALQLLSLFSFFHYSGLMGAILRRSFENRPSDRRPDDLGIGIQSFNDLLSAGESGEWRDSQWRSGVDLLIEYSLVKPNQTKQFFSIHELVHTWARNRMPVYIRRVQAVAARLVLFDSILYSPQTAEDHLYNVEVIPHCIAALTNTEDIEIGNPRLVAIQYFKFGMLLSMVGFITNASHPLRKAISVWNDGVDFFTDEYGMMLNASADVMQIQFNPYGAYKMKDLAGRVFKMMYGPVSLPVFRQLIELAALKTFIGRYNESEFLLRSFLYIQRMIWPNHERLTAMTKYAECLFYLDRLDEARDLLIDVVHGTINMVGDRHPHTLKALNNLAAVQASLGSCEEAEEMLLLVLEADDKLYGSYYRDRCCTLHNLAIVRFYQGRFDEAEELFWQALESNSGVWDGPNHWYLLHIQGVSIAVYRGGKRSDARNLGGLYHKLIKLTLGRGHPFVQAARWQLNCLIYEDNRDLPMLDSTATQIHPIFR
ncbi:FabD/lysophospholipase-like protein [Whalleya microplaca]|nr:FabD/lysophospholipase-like protein [Whalleya microplaca]